MLTTQDKARIEEEERKRIAEEQYRTEVRARIQKPTEVTSPAVADPKKVVAGKVIGLVLIVIVAFSVVGHLGSGIAPSSKRSSSSNSGREPAPKPIRWVTQKDSIASGQITVRHGGFVFYKFTITPEMYMPTLSGHFTASGGAGNDIAAILADEEGYTNWINGHEARAYWSTPGRETTGDFSVVLMPGTYYLAFSNKFSMFTDKDVFIEASLTYQKQEADYGQISPNGDTTLHAQQVAEITAKVAAEIAQNKPTN